MRVGGHAQRIGVSHVETGEKSVNIGTLGKRNLASSLVTVDFKA